MLYLDTHVIVWLYAGDTTRFPPQAVALIEMHDLLISPIVLLELQYLKEIGRLTVDPGIVVDNLANAIGLSVCEQNFARVISEAMIQAWTRDPFDRIITAHAVASDGWLLTKDQGILDNYAKARWDNS